MLAFAGLAGVITEVSAAGRSDMKIAIALLAWAVVLAGAWVIWMASQLYQVLPGVFGAEALAVVFAIGMAPEVRKCG